MTSKTKNSPIRPHVLSKCYQTFCLIGTWEVSQTVTSDAGRLIEHVDALMPYWIATDQKVVSFMNRHGLKVSSLLVVDGYGDGVRLFPVMELILIREMGCANNAYHYRKVQDVVFPELEEALSEMGRTYSDEQEFVLEKFVGICLSSSGVSTYDEAKDVCDAARNIVDCYRDERSEELANIQKQQPQPKELAA